MSPRRVLITGGASGLGAALATLFVARGDRVLVTDLAESHRGPPGSTYRRTDITSDADWAYARAWTPASTYPHRRQRPQGGAANTLAQPLHDEQRFGLGARIRAAADKHTSADHVEQTPERQS